MNGPHGTSTVYVHSFGTDDGYDRPETPHYEGYGGHHRAFGYGHIDPYLNANHGYGYNNGYGYNQVTPYHNSTQTLIGHKTAQVLQEFGQPKLSISILFLQFEWSWRRANYEEKNALNINKMFLGGSFLPNTCNFEKQTLIQKILITLYRIL